MKTRHAAVSLIAGLAAVNAVAWLWAWMSFSDRPTLLGIALLAWVFGLRHAVDADHIAAIDNVVRKLMHDGGRPMTVGLWFSLGHSTVVILALHRRGGDCIGDARRPWGGAGDRRGDRHLALGGVPHCHRAYQPRHPPRRVASVPAGSPAASRRRGGSRAARHRRPVRPAASAPCCAACEAAGTCIRSASCSGWASTPRRRSGCSASPPPRRHKACRPGGR